MKKTLKFSITLVTAVVLAFLIVVGLVLMVLVGNHFQELGVPKTPVATSTTPTATSTMKVKVALLGAQMDDSNKKDFRGCDLVVMTEREVPYSTSPLNAALKELFSKKDIWMEGELAPGNFIASRTDLFFDKATIENGLAKIYLTGKIGPLGGVCDDPRLKIQLEETAKQFPTVQSVEFYLNNAKTDLNFSEKGI